VKRRISGVGRSTSARLRAGHCFARDRRNPTSNQQFLAGARAELCLNRPIPRPNLRNHAEGGARTLANLQRPSPQAGTWTSASPLASSMPAVKSAMPLERLGGAPGPATSVLTAPFDGVLRAPGYTDVGADQCRGSARPHPVFRDFRYVQVAGTYCQPVPAKLRARLIKSAAKATIALPRISRPGFFPATVDFSSQQATSIRHDPACAMTSNDSCVLLAGGNANVKDRTCRAGSPAPPHPSQRPLLF